MSETSVTESSTTRECPWRSLLFIPATSERFLAKAHTRGADAIILDLEDAIAPSEKDAARAALGNAIEALAARDLALCVRINRPLEMAVPDIEAAVGPHTQALMLPKVIGAEHIQLLHELVEVRERATGIPVGSTRLIAVVETAAALPNLFAIAHAHPRVMALGLGNEDLCAELQAEPGGDSLYPFAMQVVAAARAAGITPFGVVGEFAGFSDPEGYRNGLRRSRRLGFSSTACIHPSQVAAINEEYGVSEDEIVYAKGLLAAFEQALRDGDGAVAYEGTMVDLPVAERARALLRRAGERV